MKLRDIIEILEETYRSLRRQPGTIPVSRWEMRGMEVKKLYIALDATFEHIKTATGD